MNFIHKHKLVRRFTLIGLCFFLFSSCENRINKTNISINADSLKLDQELGLVFYKGKPFTGESLNHYNNGQLAQSIIYLKGKRNGLRTKWFSTGSKSYEASYKDGKLEGTSKSWWKSGVLRSHSNYKLGVLEGEQKKWFKSGSIFKIQNYAAGKENGMQQAFRENGKIYANYEAKNGRIFGLKRSNLCYDLEDEKIK